MRLANRTPAARTSDFFLMITDRIGLHSVLLPLLIEELTDHDAKG